MPDPGKPENRNATATFILLITSVMEVIGDTNCESIKNQSEVMKEINHVRKINSMKQRVAILHGQKF